MAWKKSWRRRRASRYESNPRISTPAASPNRSTQALNASGCSIAIPRSGRKVASTRVEKERSAAIWAWHLRSATGSSVVQTSATFICRMIPRHENSGWVSFALDSRQMPSAVCGPNSRSLMPSGRFSSRWVQWYSGLRSVMGTVSAHFWNFSQSLASPVQYRSGTPAARIARHL